MSYLHKALCAHGLSGVALTAECHGATNFQRRCRCFHARLDVATTGWVSRRTFEVRRQRSRRLTVAQSAQQLLRGLSAAWFCATRVAGVRVHEP